MAAGRTERLTQSRAPDNAARSRARRASHRGYGSAKTQHTQEPRHESSGMAPSPVALAEPLSRSRIVVAGRFDRGVAALDLSTQNHTATNGDSIARATRAAASGVHLGSATAN